MMLIVVVSAFLYLVKNHENIQLLQVLSIPSTVL